MHEVLQSDGIQNVLLGGLLHLASQQELIQDEVGLLIVVDDVQLTDTARVLVKQLNIVVDDLKSDQFIIRVLNSTTEVEAGIALVDNLHIVPLYEGGHLGTPPQYVGDQVSCQLLLCLVRVGGEPFLQPWLSLPAEEEHELYHEGGGDGGGVWCVASIGRTDL